MLLVISSFDLISMYLAIELQSFSFYVLAAFQRNNEFSTEAGLKYFILGALASGLLLFGESLIYGFTGLTNFEELTKLFAVVPETTHIMSFTSNSVVVEQGLSILNLTYIEILSIGLLVSVLLGGSMQVMADKTITATVTHYTLAYNECGKRPTDKHYGVTASMKKAVEGTTIAMSKKYPFGTRVKIEGFPWVFTVQDRGGKITGDRVDIFVKNKKQALNFGKRKLKITILS